jgi:colanic acid biosynthesis glycosyl transferase WcaI
MTDKLTLPSDRLWVVSELYYPEQTSTGYFLTHIAEGLTSTYDVNVICGQPSYSERGEMAPYREVRNGAKIFRMKATHFDKDRLFLRIINSLTLTITVIYFALRHFERNDKVLVVTNPPILVPVLGLIGKFKRQKLFLLIHDVYPEVLAATNIIGKNSLAYRILLWIFNSSYKLYGDIIVLGRDMEKLFRDKLPKSTQITIIPNWADLDEIAPMEPTSNPFAITHGLVGKTVIQYSGNIGRTHDIEAILDAAKKLQHRNDIIFLFVGYGGKSDLLRSKLDRGLSPNVIFLPRQPREMLAPMLASATATVIAFMPEMIGISVPSRMYNILAAGVPIIAIAHPDSELCQFIEENDAGWTIPLGDGRSLINAVLEIADRQANVTKKAKNARKSVSLEYGVSNVIAQYKAMLAD